MLRPLQSAEDSQTLVIFYLDGIISVLVIQYLTARKKVFQLQINIEKEKVNKIVE